MPVVFKVQLPDNIIDQGRFKAARDALQVSEECEVLLHCKLHEARVELRAISEEFTGSVEVFVDVDALYGDFTTSWCILSHQCFESCGLSRPINSKQGEAFSLTKPKR